MANETVIETQEQHDNAPQKENLWNGGQSPFKASYGKLMIWYFLLSDAFTFGGFLLAYGALRFSVKGWPVPDFVFQTAPFGISGAPLIFVTFMTFVLIVSSVTVLRAVQEGKRENQSAVVKWMLATVVGGALFLGCQAWEWTNLISTEGMTLYTNPFATHIDEGKYLTLDELNGIAKEKGWDKEVVSLESHGKTTEVTYFTDAKGNKYFEKRDHHGDLPKKMEIQAGDSYLITYQHDMHDYAVGAYKTTDGEIKTEAFGPQAFGALFFFITGFHGFHVFTGLAFLLIIAIQAANGTYVARKNGYEMVEKVGLYWHFVDLVWVFVFLAFYLL
ncbi:cytochrome c oxidase subunit 3 [Saprospira grandis]|uniref:Cytochrome o ubiquinol oxidase subunit III n=1 Tax=Saprospira grandis (strain Lewin) TaxID=984262 RepID=H6L968_SAPGL|nr:cytochrome c oxidase subunit 3 [Saprospira grandis]AFC24240.1 cytochrome o ubiquinol oxidase subunit III [Saprospira grandis str. Lewin]